MKIKLLIIIILFTGCGEIRYNEEIKNCEENMQYYLKLIPKVDSVVAYQKEVLSSGIVTEYDINNNIFFRQSTNNDSIKAILFTSAMDSIKPILLRIFENYLLLQNMYKNIGLVESKSEQSALDFQMKIIYSYENLMESKIRYYDSNYLISIEQYIEKGLPRRESQFDKLLNDSD